MVALVAARSINQTLRRVPAWPVYLLGALPLALIVLQLRAPP